MGAVARGVVFVAAVMASVNGRGRRYGARQNAGGRLTAGASQPASAPSPSVCTPPTKTVGDPAPSERQAPWPSPDEGRAGRQRDDGQRRRRHRHGALELLAVRIVVLVAEVGDHRERVDQAQPERQRAAAGIGHRVGQDHGAGAGARHHGAGGEGPHEGLEDGRLLEHGAQVERRAAGEVDEAGAGQRWRPCRRPRPRPGRPPSGPRPGRPAARTTRRPGGRPARGADRRPRSAGPRRRSRPRRPAGRRRRCSPRSIHCPRPGPACRTCPWRHSCTPGAP